MVSVPVDVAIKGVTVGHIVVHTGDNPAIVVTWKTGESMRIVGPAVLVFRHGHRSVLIYWDGVVLRQRTEDTVSHEFPRCAPLVHSDAMDFCSVTEDCPYTGRGFLPSDFNGYVFG